MSLLILSSFTAPWPAHAQAKAPDGDVVFAIEPQSITAALAEFARLTHVNIAFRTQAVGTVRTQGIRGRHTPQVALPLLLRGTGLEAVFTGPRSAVIYSAAAPPPRGAGGSAGGSGSGMPLIELDTAQVRAPRMIGKPASAFSTLDYARRAQARIRGILADAPGDRDRPYRARIGVTLDPAGRIVDVRITRSNARGPTDAEVRSLLLGADLGGPPPPGIVQPLWFSISTDDLFGGPGSGRR